MTAAHEAELTLEFDDEHPLFDQIIAHSKEMRADLPPTQPTPRTPSIEVRFGATSTQTFVLETVVDVAWDRARMHMRTRWTARTITTTPQPTGDTPA